MPTKKFGADFDAATTPLDGTESLSIVQGGVTVDCTTQDIADLSGGGGSGTVTSVDVSGGSTGLTTSGGPVTGSGTITLSGTLVAANGGTGQTSYTIGDILYASGAAALSKLAAGTASHVLTSNGAGVAPSWQPVAAGGLTGFTAALNTASPNNGTNASSLVASGGTTNQSAVLSAKGTGATTAHIPDSTATGGNVRGTYATDWQKQRSAATQVASATGAVLIGGLSNTASGNYSFAMGDTNTASGDSAVALGKNCTATQNRCTSLGESSNATASYAFAQGFGAAASAQNAVSMGESTTADAAYSRATGQRSSTKGIIGCEAHAPMRFAANGDVQHRQFHLLSDTTNATPEAVTANNSTPGTSNQIVLDNGSAYIVKGTVVARQNTTGDSKSWEFTAHIKRGANAAATSLVAAATVTSIAADAGAAAWAIAVTADTTNGCLKIEVTGEAAKNIRWSTHVFSCNEVVG